MGNKAAGKKKRGRPSLLEVQKRSLRLQQLHHSTKQNPNPSPNSLTRVPSTRRSSDPESVSAEYADDDDEDLGSSAKKREKKLKSIPHLRDSANSTSLGSDSDGDARKKLKIDDVAGDREKGRAAAPKGPGDLEDMDIDQHFEENLKNGGGSVNGCSVVSYVHSLFDLVLTGDPPESGPSTPLPDKNLLLLILDRLQKKDTYGVFSEPVEPGELPDYHDIIKHPMDFGTVRKKLASRAYVNLEQFEKDVFLISSNAMQYNAQDTIYFRQARSIHELAKKNFKSLRQESDETESPPKVVRRGRPPSKNKVKQTVGRPPVERISSGFSSNAAPAIIKDDNHWSTLVYDLSRKGLVGDRPNMAAVSNNETHSWDNKNKSERSDEYSGSVVKGIPIKYGKKPSVMDDNRRDTYKESQQGAYVREPSVFTTFDRERKLLVPVGLHVELAYARSLARFAAKLGPIGWEIAAKQIEKVLSAGTAFGRGWVVDGQVTLQSQKLPLSTSPLHSSSQPKLVRANQLSDKQEPSEYSSAAEEGPCSTILFPSAVSNISSDHAETDNPARGSNHEGQFNDSVETDNPARGSNHEGQFNDSVEGSSFKINEPIQLHQTSAVQPAINGFNTADRFNMLSEAEKLAKPVKTALSYGSEAAAMTHVRVLDMVSRNGNSFSDRQVDAEKVELVSDPSSLNSDSPMPDPACNQQGQWRESLQNPPVPSDGFQSPGSSATAVVLGSHKPGLMLQM